LSQTRSISTILISSTRSSSGVRANCEGLASAIASSRRLRAPLMVNPWL